MTKGSGPSGMSPTLSHLRQWPLTAWLASCVGALAGAALLLAFPALALGHATLSSSDPAAESVVTEAPSRIRLAFSEQIEASLGTIALVGADGKVVELETSGDPGDVHALIAANINIAPGAYRVLWRIVSADGHPVTGSFTFTYGPDASTVPPPPAPESIALPASVWGPAFAGAPVLPSVLRGLAVGSAMALAGLLFFLAWSDWGEGGGRPQRLALALSVAAPLFFAAHFVTWLLNISPEHKLGSDWMAQVSSSLLGRVEIARTIVSLLCLWALALARNARLASIFALALLAVSGAVGHSLATEPLWTIPARSVHLLAVAAWLGGLLWLTTVKREESSDFLREVLRVSSIALVAVALVAVSGIVQAVLFLPSLGDLFTSPYGQVTLAKVAGFLVLIAFGAVNRFRAIPALQASGSSGHLQATVRRETMVMAVVVLLGGLLAYLPPPAHPEVASIPTSTP